MRILNHARSSSVTKTTSTFDEGTGMVYTYVAGCWISGSVESEVCDVITIRLVTGHVVRRLESEVRKVSPRLDEPSAWPL